MKGSTTSNVWPALLLVICILGCLDAVHGNRRGVCMPVNGKSEFCGDSTPAKVCVDTGFPAQASGFTEDDYEYLTSAAYQQEKCPMHPASYPPIVSSKEEYCKLGSCVDDSDCAVFYQRQCFEYCTYCHDSSGYCDSQVDTGIVAPLGDTSNCWQGKMEKSASSTNVRWVTAVVIVGILLAVLLVTLVSIYGVKRYRSRRAFEVIGADTGSQGNRDERVSGAGLNDGTGSGRDGRAPTSRFRLTDDEDEEEGGFDDDEVELDTFTNEVLRRDEEEERRRADRGVRLTFSEQD